MVAAVRAAGYDYVTLDLEGLRSGNLNRALGGQPADALGDEPADVLGSQPADPLVGGPGSP